MDVDDGWDKTDDEESNGSGIQCVPPPSSPISPRSPSPSFRDFHNFLPLEALRIPSEIEILMRSEDLIDSPSTMSPECSSNLETIPEHKEMTFLSKLETPLRLQPRKIFRRRKSDYHRTLLYRKPIFRYYASTYTVERKHTSLQDIARKFRSLQV